MGNTVTAIFQEPQQEAGCNGNGSSNSLRSTDKDSMAGADSLDLILNTVSVAHQMAHYHLRRDPSTAGAVIENHQINQIQLMRKTLRITGSSSEGW